MTSGKRQYGFEEFCADLERSGADEKRASAMLAYVVGIIGKAEATERWKARATHAAKERDGACICCGRPTAGFVYCASCAEAAWKAGREDVMEQHPMRVCVLCGARTQQRSRTVQLDGKRNRVIGDVLMTGSHPHPIDDTVSITTKTVKPASGNGKRSRQQVATIRIDTCRCGGPLFEVFPCDGKERS